MNTLGTQAVVKMLKHQEHKLQHEFTVAPAEILVSYDANFVASNSIAFSFNGNAIVAEVYATSHAATMAALVAKIEALDGVLSVTMDRTDTNGRSFFIIPEDGTEPTVESVVSSGASQAAMTDTWYPNEIMIGTPVAIDENGDIKPYRGAAELGNLIGISISDKSPGEYCTVMCSGYAIIKAEAGGTLEPGAVAFSVVNTTTGYNEVVQAAYTADAWAISLDDGTDGDVIEILLR